MSAVNMIKRDYADNYTPDLPTLRYYGGPIPVFLWDMLSTFNGFPDALPRLEKGKDYKVKWYNSFTTGKGVVYENKDISANGYMHYFLNTQEDNDKVCLPIDAPSRNVEGRLYEVSLRGLQELDFFYANGYNFKRTRIQIKKEEYGQMATAYTYLNTADHLVYEEDGEPFFFEGIDIVPMRLGGKHYKVY